MRLDSVREKEKHEKRSGLRFSSRLRYMAGMTLRHPAALTLVGWYPRRSPLEDDAWARGILLLAHLSV